MSSFGFTGTNSHLVLESEEEYPLRDDRENGAYPFLLSGLSEDVLRKQVREYIGHLKEYPGQDLADVGFTTAMGRTHFSHRFFHAPESRADLIETLTSCLDSPLALKNKSAKVYGDKLPRIIAVIDVNYPEYFGFGAALYSGSTGFRKAFEDVSRIAGDLYDVELRGLVQKRQSGCPATPFEENLFSFAFGYALVVSYLEIGVPISGYCGLGSGELVAAVHSVCLISVRRCVL